MADKFSALADHYRMFGRYNAWANGELDLLFFRRLAAKTDA